jgi:hypothetical protein
MRLMLIRIDDPTRLDELCVHYRRSGFHAETVGGRMLEVSRPDAPTGDQEHREVRMHLRVWRVLHRSVPVEPV